MQPEPERPLLGQGRDCALESGESEHEVGRFFRPLLEARAERRLAQAYRYERRGVDGSALAPQAYAYCYQSGFLLVFESYRTAPAWVERFL